MFEVVCIMNLFSISAGGQPTYNFVQKKGRVMYQSTKFRKVVRIARARVPLIKAEHIESGLNLDISASAPIALYNSRLLAHLISVSQPKFRSLLMAILFWAKSSNLVRPAQFSSYAIIALVS
jgi:DNA polymerase sigma